MSSLRYLFTTSSSTHCPGSNVDELIPGNSFFGFWLSLATLALNAAFLASIWAALPVGACGAATGAAGAAADSYATFGASVGNGAIPCLALIMFFALFLAYSSLNTLSFDPETKCLIFG